MSHIVLFGDSIFDNKVYVGENGKDVITHLQKILPSNWQATLKAIDGSLIESVSEQLVNTPPDATHLVVSAGGNNVLMNNETGDYANEIEPSDKGGKKIVEKILELIINHEFSNQRTQVFA